MLSFVDRFPLEGRFKYAVAASSVKDPNDMAKTCAGLTQPFAFASTVMFPATCPTVTVITLVVEAPVQPFGKVHV